MDSAAAPSLLSGAAPEASGAASHPSEGNGGNSFGAQGSPRAARSQISTAVSFEGARAAGSAALPSRSLEEESAMSAAEPDVECSHSAGANAAAAAHARQSCGRQLRPSNSLMSTAVQPAPLCCQTQQPGSPKLNRANSLVSHTAPGTRNARAGTPASVCAQGQAFLFPNRQRQLSPAMQLDAGQVVAMQPAPAQPGLLQLPPGWQNVPPVFPGLQDSGNMPAAQPPGLSQPPHGQPSKHGHHGYFDGHHRSSDNGGLQLTPQQQRRLGHADGSPEAAGQPAWLTPASSAALAPVMAGHAAAAAAGANPTSAQQYLPGDLLQSMLGQPLAVQQHITSPLAAVAAATAAAVAASTGLAGTITGGTDQQAAGTSVQNLVAPGAGSDQHNLHPAADNGGMPAVLLQQLQALVQLQQQHMQQGQYPVHVPMDGQQQHPNAPDQLTYNQQLQQALSLLLASLAAPASNQLAPAAANTASAAEGQRLLGGPLPPAAAAVTAPGPAAQHAKSCDSSILGAQRGQQSTPGVAACVGQAPAGPAAYASGMHSGSAVPKHSGPRGTVRPIAQLMLHSLQHAASEPLSPGIQDYIQQQQGQQLQEGQRHNWRSPSPSPAPLFDAAARISAAGEGQGSMHLGGALGYGQAVGMSPALQDASVAAAAAISSAGGISHAEGNVFVSNEGEAEAAADAAQGGTSRGGSAPAVVAAGGCAASNRADAAGIGSQHHQQLHQQGAQPPGPQQASSWQHSQQHQHHHYHSHHEQHGQHEQQARQQDGTVHPANSVHATMVSEAGGACSSADNEQSSTHSSSNPMGGDTCNVGTDAEIVSQPCGASHSASPAPSASVPAIATATGPLSRNTDVPSGAAGGSREYGGPDSPTLHNSAQHDDTAAGMKQRQRQQHMDNTDDQQLQYNLHHHEQQTSNREHTYDSDRRQQPQMQQQHDSSLAMAIAGPTGIRSTTVSTNSGTVDMSIHNQSGMGSQGEAPTDGVAADNEDVNSGMAQGGQATNSRDGEARGDPPGLYETADSAPHQHLAHVNQLVQPQQSQQQQSAGDASPLVAFAAHAQAATADAAAAAAANNVLGLQGLLQQQHAHGQGQQQLLTPLHGVASAAAADDQELLGSPSFQGICSSSEFGQPNASAIAGPVGHSRRECSSSAAAANASSVSRRTRNGRRQSNSGPGMSVQDEFNGAHSQMQHEPPLQQHMAASQLPVVVDGPFQQQQQPPADAQVVEHTPLAAAYSVTSHLHVPANHQQQQWQHHGQREQQQATGSPLGTLVGDVPQGSVITTASAAQIEHPDAMPQVTEIHGCLPDHQVPATAAAAQQMAAATGAVAGLVAGLLAGQPQGSDLQEPQVTEMHGALRASAGTAAEAQLAVVAAAAAAIAPAAAGPARQHRMPTNVLHEGRLPPLPHAHCGRPGNAAQAHRHLHGAFSSRGGNLMAGRVVSAAGLMHKHSNSGSSLGPIPGGDTSIWAAGDAAAGNDPGYTHAGNNPMPLSGAVATAAAAAANAAMAASAPPGASSPMGGTGNIDLSVAAQSALPVANGPFQPQQQELALLQPATSATMPPPGALAAVAAVPLPLPLQQCPVEQPALVGHVHPPQQQEHEKRAQLDTPSSPSYAQVDGTSQLGQQEGSRDSPPVGMGRVGSVPPHGDGMMGEVAAAAAGPEPAGVGQVANAVAGSPDRAARRRQWQEKHDQHDQEAEGPSHAAQRSKHAQSQQAHSKSAVTSPSKHRHSSHNHYADAFAAAVAAAAAGAVMMQQQHSQLHSQQQQQQHWQQQQGHFPEGAGQVGVRGGRVRLSSSGGGVGNLQPKDSVQHGANSMIYGSMTTGFASGSKAEASPTGGAGLDGCSIGNALPSGYHHASPAEPDQDNCAQSNSAQRGRPRAHDSSAVAAAAQEGDGSRGSRSQEARSCKRRRTSCEVMSVQQHRPGSMQTTEA